MTCITLNGVLSATLEVAEEGGSTILNLKVPATDVAQSKLFEELDAIAFVSVKLDHGQFCMKVAQSFAGMLEHVMMVVSNIVKTWAGMLTPAELIAA